MPPLVPKPIEDCYVIVSTYNSGTESIPIPCYPEELSDNTSVNWSETGIIGRSSPIYSYVSTSSRDISFSFDIHREMYNSTYNIDKLLRALRSAAYPDYDGSGSGLVPPIVTFRFGNFKTKGILNSVSFTWKKPIVDRFYQYCSVSVSMKETPNSVFGSDDLNSPLNPFNV